MAAPQITTNTIRLFEGQEITLSLSNLEALSDNEAPVTFTITPIFDGAGNSLLAGEFRRLGVVTTEFTQDDVDQGRVTFRHLGSNFAPQYTVVATANGEASAPNPPTVNFTPTNDAPVLRTNVLTIKEGETVVLNQTITNLEATDEESTPGQLTYQIVSVANGTFRRGTGETATAIATGGTFTQAEVNAGQIQFGHDGSETAPTYQLRVTDSGIPEDPSPLGSGTRRVTTTFIPVNDAPIITKNSFDLVEEGTVILTVDNLAATDVEDDDANLTFTITDVTEGRFELIDTQGNVVRVLAAPGQPSESFTQNSVIQRLVRFVNTPGTDTTPTYTLSVSDSGNPAPVATVSQVGTVRFTAVNDLPVLEVVALAIEEGETLPLDASNFLVTDEESGPDALTYTVVSVTNGRFVSVLDGTTVTEFTQADIDAGNVIAFEHDGSNVAPTFSLQVTDGGGASVDIESEGNVEFGVFNDPPIVQRAQLTLSEGQTVTLTSASNLLVTDEETSATGLVYTVTLNNQDATQPDSFIVNGVAQTGTTVTFTQAQVGANQVKFVHGGSNFAPDLTITVKDQAIAEGDIANEIPVDLALDFTAVNDAPTFSTITLSITEGGTVVLNTAETNLLTTDEESDATQLTYSIDEVENGTFQRLSGTTIVDLAVGDTFTQEEVDQGTIQFVHDGGPDAPDYRLTVKDTAIADDPTIRSVTRDLVIPDGGFIAINDDPIFSANTLTISEGETVILQGEGSATPNLLTTDEETPAEALTYTITAIANGTFQRVSGGVATDLGVNDTFTQAEVNDGLIQFVHDGGELPPDYTLTVSDTGINGDPATIATVTIPAAIAFANVNDRPEFTVNALTLREGETITLQGADGETPNLVATDAETLPDDLVYTILTLANGTFQRLTTGDPELIGLNGTFTQAEVNDGLIQFVHDGGEDAPIYSLEVTDTGINGDETTILSADLPLTLAFLNVNDVPEFTVNALTLTEGDTVILQGEGSATPNLITTDVETPADGLTYTIDAVSNGVFQRLLEGSDPATLAVGDTFTQAEVNAGVIQFVHDGGNDAPDYSLTVRDLAIDDDPIIQSATLPLTLEFTAVNDPPLLDRLSLILIEGDQVPLTADILSVSDEELLPGDITYTVDAVTAGRFVRVADDTTVTSFTQADIDAGNIIAFEHDGSNDAPTFTLTVVDGENVLTITDTSDLGVDFTPTNDAPVVEVSAFSVAEDGTVVLTPALLNTTDEETPPEDLTYQVAIANADPEQPDGFEINGVLITEGTAIFTQAQVNAGLVSFVQGGSNAPPDLTMTVTDTFDPIFGEPITVDVDLVIDFAAFNDVPVVEKNVLTIAEGATVTLSADNLLTKDEETPAEALVYTIQEVLNGTFQTFDPNLGTVIAPLAVGDTFTQADVDNGTIQFVHDGGEIAPTYTLEVKDTPLEEGAAPNSVITTVTIDEFIPINDDPTFDFNTLTIDEAGTVIFTKDNLAASDPDSALSRLRYEITNIMGGTFFLAGVELQPGQLFSPAAIAFGDLSFVDDGDEVAPSYTVTVRDREGGTTTQDATVTLNTINDDPTIETNAFTIVEGRRLTLNDPDGQPVVINLSAKDEETPADELVYTVSNVTGGEFKDFNAQPVSTFTQQDLDDGNILFIHDGSEDAPTFDITVADGDEGTVTVAANVEFIPVNDPPILEANQITVTEGAATLLSTANFFAADVDSPDEALTFTITDLVGGTFSLTTAPETAITSFTQAQLAAGVVQFVDDGDQEPPAFDVTVSDGEFESGPAPVTITDFINTNDPPTAVDDSGDGFITDEQTLFTTGSVLANDEDVDPDDVLTVVAINGQAVGAGAVTLASGAIATFAGDGTFDYDPNGKFVALIPGQSATDTFTYTVSDLAGETATATVTIEITGVNDAPTLEVNRLSISRGQTLVFSALNLFALDPDSGDEALTYTVSNVTGGQFFLDGAAATSFTQAALLAGSVSFVHDGSETAPAFEVALSDGLAALDPVATTVEQFVPVNIGAIDGGVFDYEQFVRFQNIGSVAPADEIGGLPLAQLFDEGYYLSRNADVAAAIANGALTSGYQHFSQFGYLEGRDPSVLYNEAFYLAAHSDVAAAVANGSLESGLQHFLTSGAGELRVSSPNFSQLDYLDNNADVLAAVRDGLVNSGFEHYVEFGANEPRDPRLFLYNESFYLANNADVATAVNSGALTDGFQHFISFGQQEGRAPSILFNEDSYLLSNPDIAAAVASGGFASGFSHYVQFGRFEDRTVFA